MDTIDGGPPPDRAVARFLISFIINVVCGGEALLGNVDLGVIFTLVLLANLDALTPGATDGRLADDPVPNAERRPISALAIAEELGLPRETVRRQVNKLVASGALEWVGRTGVIVASGYLERPSVQAYQDFVVSDFLKLVSRMDGAGFKWPARSSSAPPRRWAGGAAPKFLIMRTVLTFVFRVITTSTSRFGGIRSALVMESIVEANTRPITDDPHLAKLYASSAQPGIPDQLRTLVSQKALVARTGIPLATVGRILKFGMQQGWLTRTKRGYLMPRHVHDDPRAVQGRVAVHKQLIALADRLSNYGIDGAQLTRWSAQPPLGGAAKSIPGVGVGEVVQRMALS